MATKGINGTAVSVTLVGVVLAYSGVRGKKISTTVQALIAGQNPSDTAQDVPISGSAVVPGGDASGTGPGGFTDVGPTTKAGHLSMAQIYSYARQGGFNPLTAVIATAVAMAESDGNPRSHNPVPPDDSYGLMQINMIGSMGPARRAQYGLSSNEQLYDPLTNMRVAYSISSGGRNFQPWTTYTSGAYRQYLAGARKAAGNG